MKKEELLNREEMLHYLGYGENRPDEVMAEDIAYCEQQLIEAAVPKYFYKVYPIEREENRLWIAGHGLELKGESIKKHLEGCELVSLGCATLGKEVDELIEATQKTSMLDALLLDAAANAGIERVREKIEKELKQEYPDYRINWQFGIGYGDLPIETQAEFLKLVNAEEKIGLTCNENFLLVPVKSVTGFIGLKKRTEGIKEVEEETQRGTRCESCTMKDRCTLKKKCL
ncbi:MAG: methionine synthase [Lachnospiraceae bacterium]|nr:methionine synthase [Lachnospiraceae bacterium]